MAGKIEVTGFGLELVWSLDGNTISTISPAVHGTLTVHVYEVTSGTMQSSGKAESTHSRCLWAHGDSFRLMTTIWDDKGSMINIYEVGLTFTKVEQYRVHFWAHLNFGVFSPATYRISVTVVQNPDQHELLILNVCNSEVLLRESGSLYRVSFSPDGNFIVAFTAGQLLIWRYTSGHYTQWRELQQVPLSLQFSPTSSSILGHASALLHVLHLNHSHTAPIIESGATIHSVPLDAYSFHNAYIATARHGESAITITNFHSQNPSPSQLIDTGSKILGMVLTGNVLLVQGSDTVVAWLLTDEGEEGRIFGKRRIDCSDSLWAFNPNLSRELRENLMFSVEGETVAVGGYRGPSHLYHTKTGEILNLEGVYSGTVYHFNDAHHPNCDYYHYNSYKPHEPPKYHWLVSEITLQEGWVRDPEGKCRLWLHPRWRLARVDWLGRITTLRIKSSSELIVIKF